jgi:hypothetical protein
MNWRRRLVSPKDESTDARSLAFGIEWPARSGTDPTYCVGARSQRWSKSAVSPGGGSLPVYPLISGYALQGIARNLSQVRSLFALTKL